MARYVFWIAVGLLLIFSIYTSWKTGKERKAQKEEGKDQENV